MLKDTGMKRWKRKKRAEREGEREVKRVETRVKGEVRNRGKEEPYSVKRWKRKMRKKSWEVVLEKEKENENAKEKGVKGEEGRKDGGKNWES